MCSTVMGQNCEIDLILIVNTTQSVSYTHLDVYKRQVEVWGVIWFLNAEQENSTEIHREIVEVNSEGVISCQKVSMVVSFKKERTLLFDKEHTGRPQS